jgi:hypothetical protein
MERRGTFAAPSLRATGQRAHGHGRSRWMISLVLTALHPFLVCSNLPAQQLPGARCEGQCNSLAGAMLHQRMGALSLLGASKNSGAPLSPPENSHNHHDISTAVITKRYSNRDLGDYCGIGWERVLSLSARAGNFSPKVSATVRVLRKLNMKLLRRAHQIGPWPQTVFS